MRLILSKTVIILVAIYCLSFPYQSKKSPVYYEDQIVVLVYHHIDPEEGNVTIKPSLFVKQLDRLNKLHYNVISLEQFRQFMQGQPVPPNAVLITFDDGYESFYTYAYPALQQYQMSAVNFIITNTLYNESSSLYLSKDQITEMSHSAFEFQSHTHDMHRKQNDHPLLTHAIQIDGEEETQSQFLERIQSDLEQSQVELAAITNTNIDSLAYPYGSFNENTIDALKSKQFTLGFTVDPGIVTRNTNVYDLPRINAGSPYVTPTHLHNTIIRQVAKQHKLNNAD